MLFRAAFILAFCCLSVTAQQQERSLTDHGESDLIASVRKEKDDAKRLELLRQWEKQYPRSDFRQERYNLILTAQQAIGDGQEMLQTALAMVKDDPKGQGEYWLTALAVTLQDTSEAALERGEHAARVLLQNLPEMYSSEKQPSAVSKQAWLSARGGNEALAHRTLGWIAYTRHQWDTAERQLTIAIRGNPNDAEASFWLGSSLLSSDDAAKRSAGLYHIARSLAVTGASALTASAKPEVQAYLEAQYTALQGGSAGISQLVARARKSAFPPPHFHL